MPVRQSSKTVMKQLLDTEYIDAKLKELSYDHESHLVRLKYGDPASSDNDEILVFRDCFSANFNIWLEGMTGDIPNKPSDLHFFIQEILIEDIKIDDVQLYKCSMVIPMMDCQITCVTIEIIS